MPARRTITPLAILTFTALGMIGTPEPSAAQVNLPDQENNPVYVDQLIEDLTAAFSEGSATQMVDLFDANALLLNRDGEVYQSGPLAILNFWERIFDNRSYLEVTILSLGHTEVEGSAQVVILIIADFFNADTGETTLKSSEHYFSGIIENPDTENARLRITGMAF